MVWSYHLLNYDWTPLSHNPCCGHVGEQTEARFAGDLNKVRVIVSSRAALRCDLSLVRKKNILLHCIYAKCEHLQIHTIWHRHHLLDYDWTHEKRGTLCVTKCCRATSRSKHTILIGESFAEDFNKKWSIARRLALRSTEIYLLFHSKTSSSIALEEDVYLSNKW